MPDVAQLQIKVVTDGVKEATNQQRNLADQGAKTEKVLKTQGQTNKDIANSFRKLTARELEANRATKQLTASTQKANRALSSYIPTSVKAAVSVGALAFATKRYIQANISMERSMIRIRNTLNFVTGSASETEKEIEFLAGTSRIFGQDLETLAIQYGKFAAAAKNTRLQGEPLHELFEGMSAAALTMGLNSEEAEGSFTALEQILSKGQVSMEELRRQLGNRMPGAFRIAAESMGVTTAELEEMVARGVKSEQFLLRFSDALNKTFNKDIENKADNLTSAINRMRTEMFLAFTDENDELVKSLVSSFESITETLKDPEFRSALANLNSFLSVTLVKAVDTFKALNLFASSFTTINSDLSSLLKNEGEYALVALFNRKKILEKEQDRTSSQSRQLEIAEDLEKVQARILDLVNRGARIGTAPSPVGGPTRMNEVTVPTTDTGTDSTATNFVPDLKPIEEYLMDDFDLRRKALDERQKQLEQYAKDEIQNEDLKQKTLIQIHEETARRKRLIDQEQNEQTLSSTSSLLGSLANIQLGESKKAHRAQMAFAIVSATIDTYTAANKALATLPPPASYIQAAASIATGLANVQQIRSAGSFAQGGIVGGQSFTGDNMQANVNSGEMILNKIQQSRLFNMANGKGGENGGMNVTVNNNAVGVVDVQTSQDSQGMPVIEIVQAATRAAVAQVDRNIAEGGTTTSKALRSAQSRRGGRF